MNKLENEFEFWINTGSSYICPNEFEYNRCESVNIENDIDDDGHDDRITTVILCSF